MVQARHLLLALTMLAAGLAHAAAPPRSASATARTEDNTKEAGKRKKEVVPGSLLVRFREGMPARGIPGARLVRGLGGDVYQFESERPDRGTMAGLVDRVRRESDIAWIEEEGVRTRHGVSANDPLFGNQWSLPFARIPQAWAKTRGSSRVVVAIVDTGILPHPDLVDRYLPGYDFITNANTAGDGDGRDPDPTDPGTSDVFSSALHGTHVSGILGAQSNNFIGIAGVDWNCRVLPVRVLGVQGGKGNDSDIADAIRWAAGIDVRGAPPNPTPADVINLSFGGPGLSKILQEAVNAAVARGAIIIASAGNDGTDTTDYAPAGLDHVIAVGAVDEQGVLAPYSNRGPRVDLVAPGGGFGDPLNAGILSTLFFNGEWTYIRYEGTSQAAPHVTGVAALMRAVAPRLNNDQARFILQITADSSFQCPEGCGAGLLDAAAAVSAAAAQAGCFPLCGSDELCDRGRCIRISNTGVDVLGGCSAGGKGPASLWGLLLVLPLVLLSRRRPV